jgi:hypothetical protein
LHCLIGHPCLSFRRREVSFDVNQIWKCNRYIHLPAPEISFGVTFHIDKKLIYYFPTTKKRKQELIL